MEKFWVEGIVAAPCTALKEEKFWVEGIVAAPCTALKDNGDIDLNPELMDKYIKFLQNQNVTAVYTTGTNGEGPSLTVEERKAVLELWVQRAKGKFIIIAQTGGCNQREAIELSKHAGKVGADAFACMAPSFFKARSEEAVVQFIEPIAAAAPDTPFYYYDINFFTGVYLNTRKILELGKSRIPNLKGVKYSCPEMSGLFEVTLADENMQIMCGTDTQFLAMLALGVEVPVVNGHYSKLFYKLQQAYKQGDMKTARKIQATIFSLSDIRTKYGGGIGVVKATMKCLGVDLGPPRLPELPLPDSQLAPLRSDLKNLGVFDEL